MLRLYMIPTKITTRGLFHYEESVFSENNYRFNNKIVFRLPYIFILNIRSGKTIFVFNHTSHSICVMFFYLFTGWAVMVISAIDLGQSIDTLTIISRQNFVTRLSKQIGFISSFTKNILARGHFLWFYIIKTNVMLRGTSTKYLLVS